MEPTTVSTPSPSSHAGAEVERTRRVAAPSSTSSRTRCEPRKPVPPVTSVTGFALFASEVAFGAPASAFFAFAGAFLVPVLFVVAMGFEGLRLIARRRHLALVVRLRAGVAALGLPAAAQGGRVEGVARAVAQVLDLVADERGDEPVRLGAGHALRQLVQLFGREEAADARADLAPLEEGRALRERLVRAPEVRGQDAGARVEGEVGEARLELRHLPRHRARALGEDERRVAPV